jgi:hypothetical protein
MGTSQSMCISVVTSDPKGTDWCRDKVAELADALQRR